jgi:hypothetical protein
LMRRLPSTLREHPPRFGKKDTQPADTYHSQMPLHGRAKLNSVPLTGSRTGNDKVTHAPTAPKDRRYEAVHHRKAYPRRKKTNRKERNLLKAPPEKTKSVKTLVDIAKLEEDTEGRTAVELTERTRDHWDVGR